MKNIYIRQITRREPINNYGKLGYVLHTEVLINPPSEVLAEANYKKHIKFHNIVTLPGEYDTDAVIKWLKDTYNYSNINILYE